MLSQCGARMQGAAPPMRCHVGAHAQPQSTDIQVEYSAQSKQRCFVPHCPSVQRTVYTRPR